MKTRYKIIIGVVALLILLALSGVFALRHAIMQTPFSTSPGTQYIYIDHDDNIDSVRHQLETTCRPKRMWTFDALANYMKYEQKVKSGRYEICATMSVLDVLRMLRNGTQSPVKVIINPTRSIHKVAGKLSDVLLVDSAVWSQCFTDSTFCKKWQLTPTTLYSFFIPNTYEMYWNTTPEEFMQRMQQEYQRFWNTHRKELAAKRGLSPDEVVVLASIVDQETNYTPEKPAVAGMYLNRLKRGMLLQADPTVKFALGDWSIRRVLHKHLEYDSPYNTYRYKGLPPTPIALPALSSIEAVLNAEENDYLYMCAKEDFSGQHNFATNYSQHLRNARKYTQALNKKGIK